MTIRIRIMGWKETADLSPKLEEAFDGMSIVLTTRGVFVDDKNGRIIGPYRHLGAMDSIEIGEYFRIPPKHVLAFTLALSTGVEKFQFDQAMKVVEEHRRVKGLGRLMKVQLNAK